tara:strand:- start:122 stop:448 length:327 start_codon:yes stop_codon:yes gene_type:complete
MLKRCFYAAVFIIIPCAGTNAANYKQICDQNFKAACKFIFEVTEMECMDAASALDEVDSYCGDDSYCWLEALVDASEGDWDERDAYIFLNELDALDLPGATILNCYQY